MQSARLGVNANIALLTSLLLCSIVLLVGCTPAIPLTQISPSATPQSEVTSSSTTSTATLEVVSTLPLPSSDTPTATFTPTPEVRPHYSLDATFDYYGHILAVTETIHYINHSPEALTNLVLVVEPNRWYGSFSLRSLSWEGGSAVENYTLNDDQLDIPLPASLASGDQLALELQYTLLLPEIPDPADTARPQPFGYSERQVNIVDWYPYIPPYQPGEGWLVHQHWWFGEQQVYEVSDFDVRLELAPALPDLVIAASAPAQMDGNVYTYHLDSARRFALSASDSYVLQTTRAGNVDILSYSFPYDKAAGEEVLHNTADAFALYSKLIIPSPRLSLSVVEADFLDGMEYDGLFFLSRGFYNLYDGTPRGYLTFIAAHETAHQWWFGLVGNDQALEPWLDEALCTYMEYIFYENLYADYPTDSSLSMLDWWWYFRVNFYEPSGYIDRSVYDFNQFLAYRDSVYLNGAKFLDDLRSLVGDEAFFSFLRDYAQQEQYHIATTADFFIILRAHTDKDFSPLLGQYFQDAP